MNDEVEANVNLHLAVFKGLFERVMKTGAALGNGMRKR